jgi:hypothetical protein
MSGHWHAVGMSAHAVEHTHHACHARRCKTCRMGHVGRIIVTPPCRAHSSCMPRKALQEARACGTPGYGDSDTANRIRRLGYGDSDTATRIRRLGYGDSDTATRIRRLGYGDSDTATLMKPKRQKPHRSGVYYSAPAPLPALPTCLENAGVRT